jgi:hypothetical protein
MVNKEISFTVISVNTLLYEAESGIDHGSEYQVLLLLRNPN